MMYLSANPLGPIAAGIGVILFMAALLFFMNRLAKRNLKRESTDGSPRESRTESRPVETESAPVERPCSDGESSCREKLRGLKSMYDDGLITAEEYEREKESCLRRFRESDR